MFKKATKKKAKLRMAIAGPAGSGKTFSALAIATNMGARVAVIDSEGGEDGSANKYADIFDFDTMTLTNFHPQNFVNGIKAAEEAGYDVLVIDSLSHAWVGTGGVLDQADQIAKRMRSGNSFTAWKEATPLQKALIDSILQSKVHVIVTMRSKMDYSMEKEERGGRMTTVIKRVGMAPIQRDDVPYEFDIMGDMHEGEMVINKTRCHLLTGAVIKHPGEKLAETIKGWLSDGVDESEFKSATITGQMDEVKAKAEAVVDAGGTPEDVKAVADMVKDVMEEKEPEYLALIKKAQDANGDQPTIWNNDEAKKLGFARGSLEKHLRETDPDVVFDVDTTREFLSKHFTVATHKAITQPMMDALLAWMRECYEANKVL
jgi:KaiC/GvpD/RAD55 family RecA-like ATPase